VIINIYSNNNPVQLVSLKGCTLSGVTDYSKIKSEITFESLSEVGAVTLLNILGEPLEFVIEINGVHASSGRLIIEEFNANSATVIMDRE